MSGLTSALSWNLHAIDFSTLRGDAARSGSHFALTIAAFDLR